MKTAPSSRRHPKVQATSAPQDPGMAIKMAPPGLANLDQIVAGRIVDESGIVCLVDFVNARFDCADFRLVTLLTVLFKGRAVSTPVMGMIERAVLDFAFWMDEPGTDAMCMFSENHQGLFGACEYLAGQLFPDHQFTNPVPDRGIMRRLSGRERQARAEARLRSWLDNRFRFGFTEWTSSTYYEEDAAALGLLVEHAADPDLATRAAIALDLLFLDLALHCFGSRLVTTSGRAYEQQKKYPERTDVDQLLAWAFPQARRQIMAGAWRPDYARISGPLLLSSYRVPGAIAAIAYDQRRVDVRTSTGLDVAEVAGLFDDASDVNTAGLQLWAMEAFTRPESINVTTKALADWRMRHNAFLGPLWPFVALRKTGLLPLLVRAMHPATAGVAIQRANITTHRTPDFQLSSVQGYHPGDFGDQQHLWTAALPGDVAIFATNPGRPMFDNNQRGFSPSTWVGNAINPNLGQDGNVLLASYDTRGRRGYLEAWPRQRYAHLFVPWERLTQWRRYRRRVVMRAGSGFAAIYCTHDLVKGDDGELIARGDVTGWAVLLGGSEFVDLDAFEACARKYRLAGGQDALSFIGEHTVWTLTRAGLSRDGQLLDRDHPRFDSPWVCAQRLPEQIVVAAGGQSLRLGRDGTRLCQVEPTPPTPPGGGAHVTAPPNPQTTPNQHTTPSTPNPTQLRNLRPDDRQPHNGQPGSTRP